MVSKFPPFLHFTTNLKIHLELENIILSEVSQAQKAKNHMFSLICGLQTQNKCSNIIGHGSHTKGRTHTGGIGKRKET
jgi:hypothetical protein